ncbi:MAG: hypothetical protein ABJD66_13050 [Cellulophaga sp.]|uniref:hypothetical protein n=1 Tax=Cellulophaga sp. TaxID=1972202 RepID=UPI0032651905
MTKKHISYTVIILFILGIISLFLAPIINGNKTDYLINNLIGSFKIVFPRDARFNGGMSVYANLILYVLLLVGLLIAIKTNWKKYYVLCFSVSLLLIDNVINFISKFIYSIWYNNFAIFPLERRVLPYVQYILLIFIAFKILKFLEKKEAVVLRKKPMLVFLGYLIDVLIVWTLLYVKLAMAIERNLDITFELNKVLSFALVIAVYFSIFKFIFNNTCGTAIVKMFVNKVDKA